MCLATTTMIALFLQIFTCFLFTATASSSPDGFSVNLLHRRSNSSSSRLSKIQHRSSAYADTVFDTSEYLMKLQIGTPPFEIEAVLDTGSELLWTQCLPCLNYNNQLAPMFDPSKSSTYKEKRCNTPDHSCHYEVVYADKSYSKGSYASETVTLHSSTGEPFVMAETTIGCGYNNSGLKGSAHASGIVGLDLGSLSLISQMGKKFRGRFSYCLAVEGTSKIHFGGNAIVAGNGTVSTTLFKNSEKPGFYYLNLDAVSVGETRIETLGTPFHASKGNIVIDSGTTYTYLPESYCNQVKEAVEKVVTADRVELSSDGLCYYSDTIDIFPTITMHFSGGADLVLAKFSVYTETDVRGTFCFTIMCYNDPTQEAVFGNRAQNNFLVGYDPSSSLISVKPANCSAVVEETNQDDLSLGTEHKPSFWLVMILLSCWFLLSPPIALH